MVHLTLFEYGSISRMLSLELELELEYPHLNKNLVAKVADISVYGYV